MQTLFDEVEKIDEMSRAETHRAFECYREDWPFYSALQSNVAGRALCRTLKAKMSLIPDSTKDRDEICIISGAAVPFVIRPVDGGKYYEYIGEAVISGAMHGGYVLGLETFVEQFPPGHLDVKEREILLR